MRVFHPGLAVLAGDEVLHHPRLEGARAEQGDQRDDVFETVGLEPADQVLHAARLELEDGRGRSTLDEVEGRPIVDRDAGDVDGRLALRRTPGIHRLHRPVDDGQGAQSEEVELHQPHRLDVVLVELGDDRARALLAIQRGEVGQHRRRDHHAARMLSRVARQPLELLREVDEGPDVLLLRVAPAQLLFLLEGLVERHLQVEGDKLGDAVAEAVGVPQHPAHVPHDRLRRHAAVGDDLGDTLAAVALGDVLDHPVPPLHAEVDVEVGHGDTLGVQEPLEQQVVGERVEVGDPEAIRHQRARPGPAPGPDGDVVLARPADEVGHDEEVARETHAGDDAELLLHACVVGRPVRGALPLLGEEGRQAPLEALVRLAREVLLLALSGRHRKGGQRGLSERELEVAAPRDLHAVLQRLGQVGEQHLHLRRRA